MNLRQISEEVLWLKWFYFQSIGWISDRKDGYLDQSTVIMQKNGNKLTFIKHNAPGIKHIPLHFAGVKNKSTANMMRKSHQ